MARLPRYLLTLSGKLIQFFPLTFKAEYIGGSCSYPPTKRIIARSMSASPTVTADSLRMVPLRSCVSVVIPSLRTASYSLLLSVIRSQSFVALPKHTGRTPTASGSSVPVCPIFSALQCRGVSPQHHARCSQPPYRYSLSH